METKLIAKNPTAFHNYTIDDKLEAGIVLSGTEIKSIRNGKANLKDSYAVIKNIFKIFDNPKLESDTLLVLTVAEGVFVVELVAELVFVFE